MNVCIRQFKTAVAAARSCRRWVHTSVQTMTEEQIAERKYASSIVHGRSEHPAFYHPRTHHVPVALIHLRSYFPELLDQFVHFTTHTAAALAVPISKPAHLPTQRSLWTVIKSPFVHKKAQENFERRVHKRLIKAWDADEEVVERMVKYLETHSMAGVGMRVVRWQRAPVGVGQQKLEAVMSQMRPPPQTRAEKVKALGEEIVKQELASAEAQTATELVLPASPAEAPKASS
ncbi:ribosomal protein S10 [Obba rivulosa]|uniref:Small ribosomal subunit protein uS10m n=1 Tax=Obba rivulosa TaxID=1052685 RepID=A0A8E2AX76_9APHY|nr:ribosomal protein S10 [Obba rivulosa]